jgi:hypothetical protein
MLLRVGWVGLQVLLLLLVFIVLMLGLVSSPSSVVPPRENKEVEEEAEEVTEDKGKDSCGGCAVAPCCIEGDTDPRPVAAISRWDKALLVVGLSSSSSSPSTSSAKREHCRTKSSITNSTRERFWT